VPFESDGGTPDLRGILEPFVIVTMALLGEDGRAMGRGEPFEVTEGEMRRFLLTMGGVARPGLIEEDLTGIEQGFRGLVLT
jgi:hypothetical protein